MKSQGLLHKMQVGIGPPVNYRLDLNGTPLQLERMLGRHIRLEWQQKIQCVNCGRETKKSFNQGFCYPCFRSLAQCDICIVSPEKCHFHLGTCREPEWAQDHCMQDHVVYLSNTSGIKVGITRFSQIPTRWIDQGAVQALAVLKVSQRYHAGLLEVAFKQHLNDKTNWRNMLKHEVTAVDLLHSFQSIWPSIKAELKPELRDDVTEIASQSKQVDIEYPAQAWPTKISSYNLDKNPVIDDVLMAIKGQYLIFESGVVNIRKYAGYQVSVEIN